MGTFMSALKGEEADDPNSRVVAVHTKEAWDDHLLSKTASNALVVVDFKATWCGPCRFIAPAIKDLAAKYQNVSFVKIDVDQLPEVSAQWQVQAMPTFILIKGGKEVGRVVGAKKSELETKITQNMETDA